MSTYYKKPNYKGPEKAEELSRCEYIEVEKIHMKQPKQTKTSCDGYRNQYTKQASLVCKECKWFSDNQGEDLNDRSRIDKSSK